jgi:hypothetical protein
VFTAESTDGKLALAVLPVSSAHLSCLMETASVALIHPNTQPSRSHAPRAVHKVLTLELLCGSNNPATEFPNEHGCYDPQPSHNAGPRFGGDRHNGEGNRNQLILCRLVDPSEQRI